MTELALLAEQVGTHERTLRRALNQGTLRGERPTPRRLVLSPAEKRYIRRSWPLLRALRVALRTETNVRFALLFGSAARGDDTSRSDLDLLVELRDQTLEQVAELSSKLEGMLHRRVDVIPIGEAEAHPGLLADAVTDGRVLVDRDGRWARLGESRETLVRSAQRRDKRRTRQALAEIDRFLTA